MADVNAPTPNPVPPVAGAKTKTMALDYNVAALLCYLPVCAINLIFSIIFLVTEPKESKLVRFHAVQSLLLMACSVILSFGLGIIGGIVGAVAGRSGMGFLAFIPSCLSGLLGLGILVLVIVGMVKAYKFEAWKIPLIGDFAEKWSS
jgi:uncharacterized membrane protein